MTEISRESGIALMEEASRWQRAYDQARDELAEARTEIAQLRLERDDFEQRLHAYKSGEIA